MGRLHIYLRYIDPIKFQPFMFVNIPIFPWVASGEVWQSFGHFCLRPIHCNWKYFVHHCFVLPEILGDLHTCFESENIANKIQEAHTKKNRYPSIVTYHQILTDVVFSKSKINSAQGVASIEGWPLTYLFASWHHLPWSECAIR